MAKENAIEEGVRLHTTNHPTLMYMGPNGCIVEPHLRSLCTFHTCAINNLGFKPGDEFWTAKYFELRTQIEELSFTAWTERRKMEEKAEKCVKRVEKVEARLIQQWEDQLKEKE